MSPLYQFHVNVFAESDSAPWEVTWEDAAAMLERLPRMIFEPDGSFVISGTIERAEASVDSGRAGASSPPARDQSRWQVDGHLFDFAGRLHRMELRGQCPADVFDALLQCVGWPAHALAFEMVRAGVRVEEQEFRRRASHVV